MKTALERFKKILPVLISCRLSYQTCSLVYSSCARSTMFNASETLPFTMTNLQCNDRAMVRQICCIKPKDVATDPQWGQCPMNKFVVDIIYTWLSVCTAYIINFRSGDLLSPLIASKFVCFSRLLKCFRSLYGKQCGPVLGPRCFLLYLIHQ